MSISTKNPCKVVTGKCVFSYLTVNEPKTPLGGGTPKYSVSLIIPKSDTVTVERIRKAIRAAYEEGLSKLKGNSKTVPALEDLKIPLRDGDKERSGDEAYKNSWFRRRGLQEQLVHQRQLFHEARRCGRRPEPDSGQQRAVQRDHRQGFDRFLRLQHQRQPRHRLRPEQPAEALRRHAPGRPQPAGR